MTVAERATAAPARRGWSGRGACPTLGWAVLDWMAEHLPSPSDPSQPLVLTDEQAQIVLDFYRLDPATGDFHYRRARLEMAKGFGKSPLLAAIAIAEFAGPVHPGGWDAAGEPVAVPVYDPKVEIAAVSLDQADNTWSVVLSLLTANDGRAARELGIDAGITRMYLRGENRPGSMKSVTAEAGTREGARVTFAVLDETHLWLRSNGGTRLAATLRRNAAKMDGRTFETTNAPVIGLRSVAEESGDEPVAGVLHVCRRARGEPLREWPPERLRAELEFVYGGSWWAPLDRIMAELADPATDWDDALRFYFNLRSAGRSVAVDPRAWDALARTREVPAGSRVGLGFDGSLALDSTVLRACLADGYSFSLPGWSWVRPTGDAMRAWALAHPGEDWRVPRAEVEAAVADAFARYSVGLMRPDAAYWRDEITRWQGLYGEAVVVPFDTNSARQMAPVFDRWRTAVATGSHTHDGDAVVSEHVRAVHAAHPRGARADDDGRVPSVPVKGDDRRKIDGALADILAYHAAMTMTAAPEDEPSIYEVRGIAYV